MLTRTDGEPESETVAGTTDPFVAQLADVADAIAEGRDPYIPLGEGAAAFASRLPLCDRRTKDASCGLTIETRSRGWPL